mmetsp:Transcript_16664/g.42969  ORF Transcript_16664/g.42969 Transcript_16664/m.42969 type:complete len:215 (+) Transcript_16664:587-1231(+)
MIGLAKRRKGRLVNVAMMRFLCGLDVHEFSLLFADVLSVMVAEFPRTPIETANREGPEKMTLHLILFLTLMRLKTLLSLRFLDGLTGWTFSHLGRTLNRCEKVLKCCLARFMDLPSAFELELDTRTYFNSETFGSKSFPIALLPDCTYHLLPRVIFFHFKINHIERMNLLDPLHLPTKQPLDDGFQVFHLFHRQKHPRSDFSSFTELGGVLFWP